MKRTVRLNESELHDYVSRVVNEAMDDRNLRSGLRSLWESRQRNGGKSRRK